MIDQRAQGQNRNGGGRGRVAGPGEIVGPADTFRAGLDERMEAIKSLIPRRIRREFSPMRIVITAVRAYRNLLTNLGDNAVPDMESTLDAVILAAQLGLEVGEQVYLVPYKGKVTPIIGPRGLIDLSLRSGKVIDCAAHEVFEVDAFDYDEGTDWITFKRGSGRPRDAKTRAESLVAAWAKYVLPNGRQRIWVCTRDDIEYYRSFSKVKSEQGPWGQNYEGMAKKTALKRLLHHGPRDPFVTLALAESEDGSGSLDAGMTPREVRDYLDAEGVTVTVPAGLPQPRASAAQTMGADPRGDGAPAGAQRGRQATPTPEDPPDPNEDGR